MRGRSSRYSASESRSLSSVTQMSWLPGTSALRHDRCANCARQSPNRTPVPMSPARINTSRGCSSRNDMSSRVASTPRAWWPQCRSAVTAMRRAVVIRSLLLGGFWWGRHSCLPWLSGRQECLPHQTLKYSARGGETLVGGASQELPFCETHRILREYRHCEKDWRPTPPYRSHLALRDEKQPISLREMTTLNCRESFHHVLHALPPRRIARPCPVREPAPRRETAVAAAADPRRRRTRRPDTRPAPARRGRHHA